LLQQLLVARRLCCLDLDVRLGSLSSRNQRWLVLGLQSRWQRVLLAPLQIGCSIAVPCPLVLASFCPVQSLVDVAGSGSSVRRFSAVPLSSTVTSLIRWCLCICRWW
ncbi:unnamed protein product, partial [Brassica rapa]